MYLQRVQPLRSCGSSYPVSAQKLNELWSPGVDLAFIANVLLLIMPRVVHAEEREECKRSAGFSGLHAEGLAAGSFSTLAL